MKVTVCIPSRGRLKMVEDCARQLRANSVLSDTVIIVGLDRDEVTSNLVQFPDKVLYSIEDREDSLGAKYNRCAAAAPADIYVLWADDAAITSRGWDAKLVEAAQQFSDGMGVLYFGKIPGILQPGIAVTKGFVDTVGYLAPPYFPFWYFDTWCDEVGRLSGRIVHVDIDVKLLAELKGASRGVRDVAWWANFFDLMRPERIAAADRIIESGADQPYRKTQLRALRPALIKMLRDRESGNRDPQTAVQREQHFGFDAPADERYQRVKAKAQQLLNEIAGKAAA